ncbi:unnamed protein product [Cylindrotheca closterium]|uniref:Uncharacterized protein n=1 Tax=Cylindrotheca closterium TaxID=2856 RepID=A0AAD2CDC7_9STRA|nr:unnamed protein product [Cylindrotheca closterium]
MTLLKTLETITHNRHLQNANKMKAFLAVGVLLSLLVAPCLALTLGTKKSICNEEGTGIISSSRRKWILQSIFIASTYTSLLLNPKVVLAEDSPKQGLLSTTDVAELLHPVPTFTIVDKRGIPFMVVGEDAKVTGYFFTTYGEAARILEVAKDSANKAIAEAKAEGKPKEEIGTNPWTKARVSSVPLDSAITLVSKSTPGNIFRIAPAADDIEDALAITGQEDLAEGKVPMFYYKDFTFEEGDGKKISPLYFRKSELENDFKKRNPGVKLPTTEITELLSVLAELVRPGGTDNELKTLKIMTPVESLEKKKLCDKIGGKEAPFFVGQRLLVL